MTTTLESIVREQMVTYLVSRAISCPVNGSVLDSRTCVVFTDAEGDPAYVVSPEAWDAISTNAKARAHFEDRGLTLPDSGAARSEAAPHGTEERHGEIVAAFAPTVQLVKDRSADRLSVDVEEALSGDITVTVAPHPAGAEQWTTTGPQAEVVLRRSPTGSVQQRVGTDIGPVEAVAATDAEAAAALDVEARTWTEARAAIEAGMTAVARPIIRTTFDH